MKKLPKYYTSNDEVIDAYQAPDIASKRHVLRKAEKLWYDEWRKQGATDEGSCCVGKGIQVWYAGPRKRSARPTLIVNSPPVQGNLSASRSVQPALDYLAANGINAWYHDGNMD